MNSKRKCVSATNGVYFSASNPYGSRTPGRSIRRTSQDVEGALMRGPNQILGRWAWCFSTLWNAKSDNLNPDMAAEVLQQPTPHGPRSKKSKRR